MSEREQPMPLPFALNRRDLIGAASLTAAGFWTAPGTTQTTFYNFRHGDFDITVLSDGHLVLPTVIHGLDASRDDVQRLFTEAGPASDQVKPATNPVLIRTKSALILLDTGSDTTFQSSVGNLTSQRRYAAEKSRKENFDDPTQADCDSHLYGFDHARVDRHQGGCRAVR